MEPIPTVPNPKIPASQREAQETVLRYLQRTVDAMPPGSTLDGTRYVPGGETRHCDDDPNGPNAPVRFSDWRDVKVTQEVDFHSLINKIGEVWKGWGWTVIEREGYEKPNRFGYAPDGYVFEIVVSYPPSYPPSVIGASPCFPGNLRDSSLSGNPAEIAQSTPTG